MKALVCQQAGRLGIEERPAPKRGPGEVRVQVQQIGICGTDYHIFAGRHPFLEYPRVIGHEFSGVVVDPGESTRFSVGDLVIVNPYLPCGECRACRKLRTNCCSRISVMGVHADGALCEEVVVPESALYDAGGLSATAAAMIEFLAIGAHAVERGSVSADDMVLVVGIGPIGLGVALFARDAGAEVTVVDTNRDRLARVRKDFGFENAFLVDESLLDKLRNDTQNEMFDVVMDATGNASAIEAGFDYVGHAGRYVLISVVDRNLTFFDPDFHKKEMTLIASRNATEKDFEAVKSAIAAQKIPLERLHTHSCTLDEAPFKIPEWAGQQSEVIKAIVSLEEL